MGANGGIRHAELGASLSAALMLASLIAYSLWRPGATVEGSDQVSHTQTCRGFWTLTTLWQKRPTQNVWTMCWARHLAAHRCFSHRGILCNVIGWKCSNFLKMMKRLHRACSENSHQNADLQRSLDLTNIMQLREVTVDQNVNDTVSYSLTLLYMQIEAYLYFPLSGKYQ